MNNFIDKLKNRSHRRQGSTTSQLSNKSSDSSTNHDYFDSPTPGSTMHESPSFCGASLKFVDLDNNSPTTTRAPTSSLGQGQSSTSDFSHSDLGFSSFRQDAPLKRESRLSRSLLDVLGDPTALGHFITFMQSKSLNHLVKFWLEAETFRISSEGTLKRLAEHDGGEDHNICINNLHSTPKQPKSNLRQMTEQDAVAIFSKYLSKESSYDVAAPEAIRNQIINNICSEDGSLQPNCFAPAQTFVFNIMNNRYYPEYLQSVQYSKHVLEVLTEGTVYITDILYNERAFFNFVEFMEQEGQRDLIEFWLASQMFRDKITLLLENGTYDSELAQNDAMVLYDKYFSMQATSSLGFNNDIRIEVENNICREGGPKPDCFEKPVTYLLVILNEKFLPKFLNSTLYSRYLNELISNIENTLELPSINSRRSKKSTTGSSDRSSAGRCSDASVTSSSRHVTNSLLAQESPKAALRRLQMETAPNENLSIDSRTYDPDSLWQREKPKMSLGHVDSVGRYVRDVEDNPAGHKRSHSGGGKLKVAMKKLISGDNKEKEELAEKVAALIVQDIQNMTQMANGLNLDDDNGCGVGVDLS